MTVPADRLAAALSDRYRIEGALGTGGMATVYLAEDLRHDRKVAIKVLKPDLAAVLGAERFVQEIKTTAALTHPHILPLFDSGEAGGFLFYVMPYVKGETIRDRLNRETQLGVEEAVRIAREVADALDYAHRHGVIHRDIKPENLLLHDGRAMVMDFGIALAVSAAAGGRMTETGLSLGTPHYMSPEQATAEREITGRSDLYALASVLYEMLSGDPPHTGATAQQIIVKIIAEEAAPLRKQRPSVPPNVSDAVATALQKLPADRFSSAKDFAQALRDPAYRSPGGTGDEAEAGAGAGGRAPSGGWDPRAWPIPARAVGVAAALLAALVFWLAASPGQGPAGPLPVVATQLDLFEVPMPRFAVSPTGAFAWTDTTGVRIRPPGSMDDRLLPVTGRPWELGFSPDGASLVFITDGNAPGQSGGRGDVLRRVSVTGGAPRTLYREPGDLYWTTWGDDGWIYVATETGTVLRVPEAGGAPDTLVVLDDRWVTGGTVLPGGRTLLLSDIDPDWRTTRVTTRILALDLRIRDPVTILEGMSSPQWSPTGHLLAILPEEGTLHAFRFDPRRLAVLGSGTPVAEGIFVDIVGEGSYEVTPGGMLAYRSGPSSFGQIGASFRLASLGTDGSLSFLPLQPTGGLEGAYSPDGRRLAYRRDGRIWVFDLEVGTHRELLTGGPDHVGLAWSPDGRRIAFGTVSAGVPGPIHAVEVDGGSEVQVLGGRPGARNSPAQWLSDGTVLLQSWASTGGPPDIYRLEVGGDTLALPVLDADWGDRQPQVSPDGRWLAYISSEGGRASAVVRRWPDLTRRITLTGTGSTSPLWSPDGRTLYLLQSDEEDAALRRVVAYGLEEIGGTLRVTGTRTIHESREISSVTSVHPDGRNLLVFLREGGPLGASGPLPVILVTNWTETLRERVGR